MKRVTFFLLLTGFGVMLTISPVRSATVTSGASAPGVNEADIANFGSTFSSFGSSFMWPDRPARGQSFVTGSFIDGYWLSAITVQSSNEAEGTNDYNIRVGEVSGTGFSPISTETASYAPTINQDDFVTFTLDSVVTLSPSTTYGFDIGLPSSDGGFSSHGWQQLNNPAASYADGSAYSSGGGGSGGATVSFHNQDRIFHLDLVAIPEPSRAVILCLGAVGLLLRRRRG